jgi:hypothetical protein
VVARAAHGLHACCAVWRFVDLRRHAEWRWMHSLHASVPCSTQRRVRARKVDVRMRQRRPLLARAAGRGCRAPSRPRVAPAMAKGVLVVVGQTNGGERRRTRRRRRRRADGAVGKQMVVADGTTSTKGVSERSILRMGMDLKRGE